MSHIVDCGIVFDDLQSLKASVNHMKAEFHEGVTTYKWFGISVGDYALPEGITKDMLGKCKHVIRLPGCEYEIGVVRKKDGTLTLLYDFWGPGEKLHTHFGVGLAKLTGEYSAQRIIKAAKAKGYTVKRYSGMKGETKLRIEGKF